MIELISLLVMTSLLLVGLYCYKRICRNFTLDEIERRVAQQMEQRAHKLCMQAFEVQRTVELVERNKLDEQFQDDLHLYVEDFQAEVAEGLQKNRVQSVQSYGFIRLTKH